MKPKYKKKEHRSGLETAFNHLCKEKGFELEYETDVLPFVTLPQKRRYTPDWTVRKGRYIETKGRWDSSGRKKALYVKEQHPTVRILYVFQRPNNTLSKVSKTTYGEWATKNGIEWCGFEDTKTWFKWIKEALK